MGQTHKAIEKGTGYFLPAEWAEQSGVELIWPSMETDWRDTLEDVQATYLQMARAIAERETLLIVASHPSQTEAALKTGLTEEMMRNVIIAECSINDTWARDSGFITMLPGGGGEAKLTDFRFNGWGGKFAADRDNAINSHLYNKGLLRGIYDDASDFILEGGSIESDGEGTIMTTTSCLLSPGRNGFAGEADMERRIMKRLNAGRLICLHHGALEGDDTDGHIDTLARFCPDRKILYIKCVDPRDDHYPALSAMEEELQQVAERYGYTLVPVPLPRAVYDAKSRARLPATYANFLIINGAVLCPTYDQEDMDSEACRILAGLFPGREIIGIAASPLIRQGGSVHCSTMQFPAGVFRQS